jgi:Fic family protein
MLPADFSPHAPGRFAPSFGGVSAFIPDPAPRELPVSGLLARLLGIAERRLGELAGAAAQAVNPHLVSAPLLRQEALLSSRIEGTVATPEQLALFETGVAPATPETGEVGNFVRATRYALEQLADGDVIAGPLLREAHRRLLTGVRGDRERPGEYRDAQNFLGSSGDIRAARFVPPPPRDVPALMADLERYVHEELPALPDLVRAAIAHYQFETIHPFRDGNGRIGRLLVTLLLVRDGVLPGPLLPISVAIERRRTEYVDALLAVSMHAAWDRWLHFFLECTIEAAELALRQVQGLAALREEWRAMFLTARTSGLLLKLVDHLFQQPALSMTMVRDLLGVTHATASARLRDLERAGIVREATGRTRDRIYVAPRILAVIGGETSGAPGG